MVPPVGFLSRPPEFRPEGVWADFLPQIIGARSDIGDDRQTLIIRNLFPPPVAVPLGPAFLRVRGPNVLEGVAAVKSSPPLGPLDQSAAGYQPAPFRMTTVAVVYHFNHKSLAPSKCPVNRIPFPSETLFELRFWPVFRATWIETQLLPPPGNPEGCGIAGRGRTSRAFAFARRSRLKKAIRYGRSAP